MRKNNKKDQNNRSGNNKRKNKNKKDDGKLNGFSSLNQVTGVPKPVVFHSRIPVPPVKVVKEPKESCAICGKTIELIADSLINPKGEFEHFECVLAALNEKYQPREDEKISYIGKGAFGLCAKDENGKWFIKERIPYESKEDNEKMHLFVEGLKSE